MSATVYVIALVFVAKCLLEAEATLDGQFDWKNRQCKWRENRKSGKGPRELELLCPAKNNLPSIMCTYKGNPHDCGWYNKGNQQAYYQCLVDVLKENKEQLCLDMNVNCNKECKEIVFERIKANVKFQVNFKWKNGQCEWSVSHEPEPGPRELKLSCPPKMKSPGCTYNGNPHPCTWYNKNQQAYYQCLVDVLKENKEQLCEDQAVKCKTECKEIVFTRIQAAAPFQLNVLSLRNIEHNHDYNDAPDSDESVDDYIDRDAPDSDESVDDNIDDRDAPDSDESVDDYIDDP